MDTIVNKKLNLSEALTLFQSSEFNAMDYEDLLEVMNIDFSKSENITFVNNELTLKENHISGYLVTNEIQCSTDKVGIKIFSQLADSCILQVSVICGGKEYRIKQMSENSQDHTVIPKCSSFRVKITMNIVEGTHSFMNSYSIYYDR